MSLISESAGLFLASDPTKGVRFQMWPDNIQDSKVVNWSNIEVIGRSEPILAFHSSGSRELAFMLLFAASVDEADDIGVAKVQERVNFLKSCSYPTKSKETGFSTMPPVLTLIVGDLIYTRCVIKSIDISWAGTWEFDFVTQLRTDFSGASGRSGLALRGSNALSITEDTRPLISLPHIARVNLGLVCLNEIPLTHDYVLSNGDRISKGRDDSRDDLRNFVEGYAEEQDGDIFGDLDV